MKFHNLIIAFSTLTAFLTVLTVISGSSYLYDTLSIYRFGQVEEIKPGEFYTARVTLPGLWSCTYLGFWFSIEKLIVQQKNKGASLFYGVAVAFMVTAFLLNLSRTIIVGIATGLFVVMVLCMLFLTTLRKSRVFLVSIIILVTVSYVLQHFECLFIKYQERFDMLTEAVSVKADKNKYMLGI